MYGFHKVPHLMAGALLPVGSAEVLEFSNQYFKRDHPELLIFVSRKKTRESASTSHHAAVAANSYNAAVAGSQPIPMLYGLGGVPHNYLSLPPGSIEFDGGASGSMNRAGYITQDGEPATHNAFYENELGGTPASVDTGRSMSATPDAAGGEKIGFDDTIGTSQGQTVAQRTIVDIQRALREIDAIKATQSSITADLQALKEDNQEIWRQTTEYRDSLRRQQETLDRILRFLASVYSGNWQETLSQTSRSTGKNIISADNPHPTPVH